MVKDKALMKKQDKIEYIVYIVALIFLAWIIWSFIDVNVHNSTTETYSKYNAFVLLMKACGK